MTNREWTRGMLFLAGTFLVLSAPGVVAAQVAGQPMRCNANAGVPPMIRAEGYAELGGDLLLTCTGGDPGQRATVDFDLHLNTNFTSRLVGDGPQTEALLLIDEPGTSRFSRTGDEGTPPPFCLSPSTASHGADAPCNPLAPAQSYQQGTYTMFRGERHAENNRVVWKGIPVLPPGAGASRTFRFTNIRVNASRLGPSTTLIPTMVVAFISISPNAALALDNPQQVIAYVLKGHLFDTVSCSGEVAGTGVPLDGCAPGTAEQAFAANPNHNGIYLLPELSVSASPFRQPSNRVWGQGRQTRYQDWSGVRNPASFVPKLE